MSAHVATCQAVGATVRIDSPTLSLDEDEQKVWKYAHEVAVVRGLSRMPHHMLCRQMQQWLTSAKVAQLLKRV